MTRMQLAQMIDLAVLKPDAKRDDILRGCEQAKAWRIKSLFVLPCWLDLITKELDGSGVLAGAVIAFPFGAEATDVKFSSAEWAMKAGAYEVDMVMAIGRLKSGDVEYVRCDISSVVETVKQVREDAIVKVILETGYLTDEEKTIAAQIAESAGADFVKTSTGFGPKGATVEDVILLRQAVSASIGVKASGGIRTYLQAKALIDAGANRLGTSDAVSILSEISE